jgi:diguanylate cyclase (GGDEF)-like protein
VREPTIDGTLMDSLPRSARLYVGSVIAVGVCLLAVFAPWSGLHVYRGAGLHYPYTLFASLLLLSSICSAFKVSLPLAGSASTMSVSYAVDFGALVLLGPNQAMLITAASVLSQCTVKPRGRNPLYKIVFSMAALVITVQAAGRAYWDWLPFVLGGDQTAIVASLAGAITVYFLVNSFLVAAAVALSSRRSIFRVWQQNFLWGAPGYFFGGIIAAVAANLVDRSAYYFAVFAAVPLYLTYRAYRVYMGTVAAEQQHVREISNLHLATVEALALAIDAKDQRSHTHIRRMQIFAATVGKALAMNGDDIDGLRTAALLHDIGKLAVPEHILSKPGPLTPDEVKKVRIHPVVGAEIIAQVPFPYPVAPLILCHHERWDGRGYPSGLKADEIPLGARIIAVIDFYDALTSDRPYHPAMSHEAAARLVQQEAGRAFDPAVVSKFLDLLPELPALVESMSPSLLKPRVIQGLSPQTAVAPDDQSQVLQNIALAHREIYALYEIAQAMGTSLGVTDTMKLISSKLTNLVPFSCCALYLYNDTNDALRCRFATGTDADIVRRVTVKNGHGMTGWVARNRRPLLNARPSADLESSDVGPVQTKLQAALVCPLVFNEEVIGTLAVYHTEASFYNEDHARLLDRVCEQAAAVIANSIVFEKTQQESLTDALTALPNTRFLFMHLTRELARAERLKSEVGLLVMDLDDFKEINDKYGHHVGDRALQEVASVLRTAIRPYDTCVRYAGDEFIVVLPGCGGEEAESKRVDLQKAVDGIRLEARPGKLIPIGVSAGVAVFPVDGDGYDSLLAIADARMYRDKTKRKKAGPRSSLAADADMTVPADLSEIDLHRAAAGIL